MESGEAGAAAALGRALRAERERQGISVEVAARAICVAQRVIGAIEEGRVRELPPPPYARGFIEAYASWLGVDAEALPRAVAEEDREAGGSRQRIFRAPSREGFFWRDWTIPLALAAGLAAYLAAHAVVPPRPEPLPLPLAAPPPLAGEAPAEQEGGPAGRESGMGAASKDEAAPLLVVLRFEGETWVEVAIDGAPAARHDARPGDMLTLAARERITASLGDAGMVRIRVNGRELGFVAQRGETRRGLLFTAPGPAAAPRGGAQGAAARQGAEPAAGD